MRGQVLIATKCGIRKAGSPHGNAPYRYDFSADYLIASCEGSLRRLGVDTIDLYQLHRPDLLAAPAEVADAFGRLRQAGKVREFGVSNFHPSQVAMLQKACPWPLRVNQIEISLGHLAPFWDGTLDQCLTDRLTPMAWSPLAGGKLLSQTVDMTDPRHAQRQKLLDTMDLVARERGVSRAVIAIAWLLRHPAGIVPIIGSTDPGRIRELAAADTCELTREEWYRLLEAAHGQRLP
jgi:predicted oxidoreductase